MTYTDFVQGTLPAWRKGLEQAEPESRKTAMSEILESVLRHYDGNRINFGGNIFVVTASW